MRKRADEGGLKGEVERACSFDVGYFVYSEMEQREEVRPMGGGG